MGLLLGDVHLSELERLDKPCATVGRELAIIRFAVNDTSHSAILSPHSIACLIGRLYSTLKNNYKRCCGPEETDFWCYSAHPERMEEI